MNATYNFQKSIAEYYKILSALWCMCVNIRNITSQYDAYNHLLFKIKKKKLNITNACWKYG